MHQPTPQQSQYLAWLLTRRARRDSIESLAGPLLDAQVDLNPHQVEAALFACKNPLERGVILADEVGLGKTIEAGLVILQHWAERKRRILIITPANLRKQWHQEIQEKFGLDGVILEKKNYNALRKNQANPFIQEALIICSYQFAKSKADDIQRINWDLVVLDEAHRLRNVYKNGNIIARTLKNAMAHVQSKVLPTATPLQNSLLKLYGLVSIIDGRVFGDLDSFRAQFTGRANFDALRKRLAPVCKRTLRQQVQPYVSYTARRPIVQEFTPSAQEKELAALVADYLRRPGTQALPAGQRQLISLVLWKLLASSSRAIAGALRTMQARLQGELAKAVKPDLAAALNEDYENLAETAEEWEDADDDSISLTPAEYQAIASEADELRRYCELAENIREDEKSRALLKALEQAFAEIDKLGAPRKAIIFTESRRTQDYLHETLANTAYAGENGDGIILFNGSNSDAQAQKIYKNWLKRHEGSDKITGSKTADTRAALVEHFKENGTIMIATEAGAEGINLQFCPLVINYDLPWNPQRIEQRIGRCHRYGQKHDVVVVNFVDRSNEADARVYELLDQKFQLFSGVFGTSDEVLGAIGSGVDIERRIADIYRHCRLPADIKAAFAALQQELADEINQAILNTRRAVLENFDESVQKKLGIAAQDARSTCERTLMQLTASELGAHAAYHAHGFTLHHLPAGLEYSGIPLGCYALPQYSAGDKNSRTYRLTHPLAQWVLKQAKQRACPPARLTFDYAAYGNKISSLEPWRGQSGYLTARLLDVTTLGKHEQHLLLAACTTDGTPLIEDDPEKLLKIPARSSDDYTAPTARQNTALHDDLDRRRAALLAALKQQDLAHINQEEQKLDDWADDLKQNLEQAIKETDREIKEVRRTAASAVTLDEKLHWQKKKQELENKRRRQRRELFDRQDEIDAQRNILIAQLEAQMEQKVKEEELFIIESEIV